MEQAISQLLHARTRMLVLMKEAITTFSKKYQHTTGPIKVASVTAFCGVLSLAWFAILITSGI